MIPIDRTNCREVRDAIEKRGGRIIVRRNLRTFGRKLSVAWVCVALDSCSGLNGIFAAEIEEPATLDEITRRLAKMLDQVEAFFEEATKPARIAEEAAIEIETIRNETSRLIQAGYLRYLDSKIAESLGVPYSLFEG